MRAAVSRQTVPEAIRQKAAQGRPVRVLVQLNASFRPEGRLSRSQALDQRQAISRVQDTVLGKLAGQRFKLHARYEHIPYLALEVDAKALDVLSRMPGVAAVQLDALDKPSLLSSEVSIGVGVAWSKGLTGAGQTVAILDTGVDKTHPWFNGGRHAKVVSEACYSSNAFGFTTTVCPRSWAPSARAARRPTSASARCSAVSERLPTAPRGASSSGTRGSGETIFRPSS